MSTTIEKVYSLKAAGGKAVYDDLDRINKMFIEIKKNKIDMGKALSEALKAGKQSEANDYAKRLKELKVQEQEFVNLRKKAMAQLQELLVLQQKVAGAKMNDANESIKNMHKEREETAKLRKEMAQMDLDRRKARATAAKGAPGSYNDIAGQYRDLLAQVKSTVNLNGGGADLSKAQSDLMKLKNLLDSFNRELTKDKLLVGEYTTGVVQAFQRMGLGTLVTDHVNHAKGSLTGLNAQFEVLKNELAQIRSTGVGSLDAVERQLVENRQAALALEQELHRVQTELRNSSGVGGQMVNAISNEFKNLKQQVVSFVVGYMGFMQMISLIHQSVRTNYELSDSFADIKNRIHGTDEEVESLVESLKKLDTRTGLAKLTEIAAIVSKKGVVKEEIAGVTKAIDDLMITMGHEAGDAKETVSSLVKLVNVYSEDKHVTAENINAIGGAIARLTTTGVATGRFLIDFAERMAGVRGITGVSIDSVLGFGAALEELGQSAEVSATATSQVLVKLFTDAEKYAGILDMSVEAYKNRLQHDVIGTFVLVAEKLKGNAGEMAHFFEGMQDMHLKGQRALGVTGDVAANVDYIVHRMIAANAAMKESGITAQAAAAKQENFAATIDRIKKEFELIGASKGAQETMKAISGALLLLIQSIPTLVKLAYAWLVVQVAINAELILTKVQLGIINVFGRAYALTLSVITGGLNAARWAQLLWTEALFASPIGTIAATIGILTAGVVALTYAISGNSKALDAHAQRMLFDNEAQAKANQEIAGTMAKLKVNTAILKDNTASIEARTKALKDLIALNPQYLDGLTLENIKTKQGTAILDEYVAALNRKAKAEAAQSLLQDKYKRDAELQAREYELELKVKGGESEGILEAPYVLQLEQVRMQRQKLADEIKNVEDIAKRATGAVMGAEGHRRTKVEIEDEIEQVEELRKHYAEGTAEFKEYTRQINELFREWQAAGGRAPEAIKKEIRAAMDELKAAKDDMRANQLRELIRTDRKELQHVLDLLEIKKGRKSGSGGSGDTFTSEVNAESKLTRFQAKVLEQQLQQEMDVQKAIFDNEQNGLHKRLEAYAIYSNIRQRQLEEETNADLKVVQDKLTRIAGIETAVNKKSSDRTPEESKYFDKRGRLGKQERGLLIQKSELQAEFDAITETAKTKQAQLAREIQSTIAGITKGGFDKALTEMNQELDAALAESYKRATEMRHNILTSNFSDKKKEEKLAGVDRKEAIDDDTARLNAKAKEQQVVEAYIQEAQRLEQHNSYMLGAEIAYQLRLIEIKKDYAALQRKLDDNKYADQQANKEKEQAISNEIKTQAIGAFEQIGSAYVRMVQQQADVALQRQQKELEYNKRVAESQNQSLREKESNDRAYEKAQEQLEKARIERNRRAAKAQMAMDYAVAVMRIWANYKGDFGVTEGIQIAALTGVYAAKLAALDADGTFEQGGAVPGSGGVFGGKSHANGGTRFHFKGRTFEAEADELAIINKRSARSNQTMTVTGTPKQIASGINAWGGGYDFAPGALVRMHRFEYGGHLGAGLQLPSFISDYYTRKAMSSSSSSTGNNDELLAAFSGYAKAMDNRIDRLQVMLDPSGVHTYNNNVAKATRIGAI